MCLTFTHSQNDEHHMGSPFFAGSFCSFTILAQISIQPFWQQILGSDFVPVFFCTRLVSMLSSVIIFVCFQKLVPRSRDQIHHLFLYPKKNTKKKIKYLAATSQDQSSMWPSNPRQIVATSAPCGGSDCSFFRSLINLAIEANRPQPFRRKEWSDGEDTLW